MYSISYKWIFGLILVILMAYPAYKLKSALGIDIIHGYHAPDLVKVALHTLHP
jgi:hypothetical protein